MAIPPDQHYIAAFNIEDVLLDKDTGAPLTGGVVTFYRDSQRLVKKPVYQITGTSPDYTFIELPNPMILSAIGTFEDALGNPVVPYFYPFTSSLVVDLYYITVESSGLVSQFTREAVPWLGGSGGSGDVVAGTVQNDISNPQFAEVLFDTTIASFTFSFSAETKTIEIAPDWSITAVSPAAGTVTVTQLTPLGTLNLPTNPGTLLQISSTGLTSLLLRQRITGSPNLWGSGYISSGFMAKVYGGTDKVLKLYYSQSDGTIVNQELLSATLPASGAYGYYPGTKFIDPSTSTQDFPDAYIDIYFDVPLGIKVDITSVMIAATGSTSVADIGYDQESNPRQIDHLFHYYKPQLAFKPIPSFMVGWDFPLNPAQFYGSKTIAAPVLGAANRAYYAWDQTIVFQTVDAGMGASPSTTGNGAFVLTPPGASQGAIIQYLAAPECIDMLLTRLCSMLTCAANSAVKATITIWYTTNVSLPTLPATFFTGLDANGLPTGVIGGWTKVPRGSGNYLGDATFDMPIFPATTNQGYEDVPISGWDLNDYTTAATATFIAVVIGTGTITAPNAAGFKSISVQAGAIPTVPAPQTPDEVYRECQRYYQKSFQPGIGPASALGGGTGESEGMQGAAASTACGGPIIRFPTAMIHPPVVTRYNVIAAGTEISSSSGTSWTGSATLANGVNGFATSGTTPGGSPAGSFSLLHWTADARLGTY